MDSSLHERLVAGDQRALAEIYDLHSGVVHGLALKVTRDKTIAEDIAQEVFMSLWEQPDRFDPGRGTLRAWLCTLAHRRAVDWIRRNESQRRRWAQTIDVRAETGSTEQTIIENETKSFVHSALAALPKDQFDALNLAYFGGHTYRQVAELLAVTEGTIKSRIRLALNSLSNTFAATEVTI